MVVEVCVIHRVLTQDLNANGLVLSFFLLGGPRQIGSAVATGDSPYKVVAARGNMMMNIFSVWVGGESVLSR